MLSQPSNAAHSQNSGGHLVSLFSSVFVKVSSGPVLVKTIR